MIRLLAGILLCCALSAYPQAAMGEQPRTGSQQTESPRRLSAAAAVDMAIKNNLNLETARLGLDIKKRKSDTVWNQFLPTVGITGTLARTNKASSASGTIPSYPLNLHDGTIPPNIYGVTPYSVTLPQWNVSGAFSATFDFSFALFEGMRSVKLDYEAGLISMEKAKLQMEQGVRKMYNSILLLEANTALLGESYNNTQRQAAIAEANYKAGLAPRLTWLQAQVAVENIKPAVNDLENTLNNLKGNFALLLGLSFDTPFELEPVSTESLSIPLDVANLISRAASGKPDIKELQANIMTLHSQRKALATQQYTPFLRLGWSLNPTFIKDPFQDTWFNSDNWMERGNFYLTLGMSFNAFFPFTKEGQQRKDMEASIQIQNIRLAQAIRETELEIFTKINSLEKIRTTKEAQQATTDLAEQSYRLTEEAYRAGLQDFQAVQNAALALDQAKLQLLREQFNYLNDLIDLEYSIGVPFGTLSSK